MRSIAILSILTVACSDTTTKTFNDSPTITIMSHSDGHEALEGDVLSLRALASDTNHSTEELLVAWYVEQTLVCDWTAP